MKDLTSKPSTSSCRVRPFEPSDRAPLLGLYEQVFGRERSVDWFRWKFEDNPYADHVPIVVAERDGDIVGCRAFFAQELRIDGTERIAFQPCDTMVHPDHRNEGLFSRMNEYALERYAGADGPPACCFNFPNENSKPGNLKHGWREIGTVPVYYRPQDPIGSVRALTDGEDGRDESGGFDRSARGEEWVVTDEFGPGVDRDLPGGREPSADAETSVADALADVVASSQQAGDRLVTDADGEFDVVRFETPPPDVLESIYRRSIPPGIHTNRTAEFYRWRCSNPAHTYAAYVAMRDGGTPVAALICSDVDEHLRIVETLPREIEAEATAIDRLLAAVLADRSDNHYVTAFGETLPSPIQYRFYPDTRFPLSTLIRPSARTLLARDFGGARAIEETAVDDWTLSRLDLDTS
ncbi:GNAT family N-acetyltransferase [Haloterrigena sp. SYSU A558-1]|uniref:GNAT family N-acetyltransferase n=1 Tax=Haloterrigena gelatinilytica TaxID=2741724 RepID=A0ABX2LNV3_9EURY|nr:GNAT family N-acetyltransferase [Haloterrigena gelatinilytica]NUC74804.1 GNAT family N-acetyltransferase [Haloterrigena gelatinilytica]